MLAEDLFAEVLGRAPVGIHDNFFDLGGSSLQAMQLLARLRDLLEVDAEIIDLFSAPTVTGLAEVLRTEYGAVDEYLGDDDPAAAAPPGGPRPDLL